MSNRFFALSDAEAVRLFRAECKRLHPDMPGGSCELFRAMIQEYQNRARECFDKAGRAKYGNAWKGSNAERWQVDQATADLLQKTCGLPFDLIVELVGNWIWVTGDTRSAKDQLKAFGMHWAPKKAAWYFHSQPYQRKNGRHYSLDQIRARYGSERVEGEQTASVA